MIRTVLVDDHKLFSEGLKRLLEESEHFQVIRQFQNGISLLESIDEFHPELVILDIDIPGINGLDLLSRLRIKNQAMKIVMLTMHEEAVYSREAISSGADGYLTKSMEGTLLVTDLLRIMEGGQVFSAAGVIPKIESKILSKQELKILKLIAAGKTSEQIAAELSISSLTVKSHRRNMMKKLRVESAPELVSMAFSKGIL